MTFPDTPLPVRQELLIDGAWVDITPTGAGNKPRNDQAIQISRGFSGEQASISSGSCEFTLDNRNGYLSNRNPNSPYFRQVGRNTQTRVSVTESVPFLKLADYSTVDGSYDGAEVSTADKAVLDITGDIDVRADIQPDRWIGGYGYLIGGKYVTSGNQRSWYFMVNESGYPQFTWSTDGTSGGRLSAICTVTVPMDNPRLTLRVTLDVNNGAGGNTATFYTSDSVTGSWTTLGSAVVAAGTTSIFSSSAPLEVGDINSGSGRGSTITRTNPFIGKIYRFQVYDGIAGTLRADMYPGGQAEGVTSWSDGLSTPNTWATAASAAITKADYRFWGEIPKLPQRWDPTAADITVPTHAGDRLERLSQKQKPLASPIRINLDSFVNTSTGLVDGYWPCEGTGSDTTLGADIGFTGAFSGASLTTDSTLPGTAGVLAFSDDDGYALGQARTGVTNTQTAFVLCYFKFPSVPAGTVPFMYYYFTGGTVATVTLSANLTTYIITATKSDGTSLLNSSVAFGAGAEPNQWIAMRILFTESAGTVTWEWAWYPVGAPVTYGTGSSFSATIGRPNKWLCPATTGRGGTSIAHVLLSRANINFDTATFIGSTNGYANELCDDRVARICRQIGIPYWIVGRHNDAGGNDLTERMGPQPLDTPLNIIKEAVLLDGGYLYGPRDKFGIAFRLRSSLVNAYTTTLDYSAKVLSGTIAPDENTTNIANDVIVTRPAGGFGRWVKTSGPLNISEPADDPDGVGLYDTTVSLNAYLETRLVELAQDQVLHGTVDELRYPVLTIELARRALTSNAALTAAVRAKDQGDAFTLTNLPSFMPPDDVDLIINGYTEWLRNRSQEFTYNLAPYSVYRTNDLSLSTRSPHKTCATVSSLNAGITSSATSFAVKTTSGKLWYTGASNLDVFIGGERMTVGSISGTTSPQTFSGVTRSVNGVVKAHSADDVVQVVDKFFVAR